MKCYIKDYPRPQFVRTDWEKSERNLDFGFDDENAGGKEKWYQEFKGDKKINVPLTYETKLSGYVRMKPAMILSGIIVQLT